MGDRLRLAITGVAAVGVLGLTVAGPGLWSRLGGASRWEARVPLAQLKDFSGIRLEGPDDVIVTSGPAYAVRIDGTPAAAKSLRLSVRRGVLHVSRRGGGWLGSGGGTTVHVTMPALARVWIAGSGSIRADKVESRAFSALVQGAGDLQVKEITADEVRLTVQGSGDVSMSGRTNDLRLHVVGSGDVAASDLQTRTAVISVTGSGNVRAHADDSAQVRVTGSGNAHVDGTNRCQIVKTGSGVAECSI